MTDHIDDKDKYAHVEPGVDGFIVRDSGTRQEFETGSRRDTREGKGRFDLIPTYPMVRVAQHYERGAAKYGDRNWEKGQPLMRYLDSAARHLNQLLAGDIVEDHASAIVFNIFGYVHTLNEVENGRLPLDLDDRPQTVAELRTLAVKVLAGEPISEADFFRLLDGTEGGDVLPEDNGCTAEGTENCVTEGCGVHDPVIGLA